MCYSGTTVPLRDLLCNQDYSHNLCEVVDLELDEVLHHDAVISQTGTLINQENFVTIFKENEV